MSEQNRKGLKQFFIILAVCFGISFVFIFARGFIKGWSSDQYEPLDYTSVMTNPSIFKGEGCSLNGKIRQIVRVSPDAETKYSYFLISERENDAHEWLVYGRVSPSDFQKIQTGMDMSVSGICVGQSPLTSFGKEVYYPTIYFDSYQYGYQFGD